MTRIIVVRHGETRWNLESRLQGHGDSPLTESGIAQADAIAGRLAGETFDALISSDLGRALETARRIAARTGHAIVADTRFRERNFGRAEGMTFGEMDSHYPELFSRVRETDPDYDAHGGETRRQLFERVRDSFAALAREQGDRCVAVVCHGGVLASLYRVIHGIPVAAPHPIPIPNAGFNVVRFDAAWRNEPSAHGPWSVEAWGDTRHLEAEGSSGGERGSLRTRMS
jgi:probable phosphoglycerate mutase